MRHEGGAVDSQIVESDERIRAGHARAKAAKNESALRVALTDNFAFWRVSRGRWADIGALRVEREFVGVGRLVQANQKLFLGFE
jgi:hypothetical protein